MKILSLIFLLLSLSTLLSGQNAFSTSTDGVLTFQVTTVTDGATYAPRHCLAIWIKDAAGNFIISRKVMANSRKQHLVKWVANSNYNVADAVTGATLNAHTSHTVSWDCRNVAGNLVPDGTYQVWIEYTSRNSASNGIVGPFFSFSFEKGETPLSINIPDEAYFKNMSLNFEPIGVFLDSSLDESALINITPNPFIESFSLSLKTKTASFVNIGLYNQNGVRIDELYDGFNTEENLEVYWTQSEKKIPLVQGNYYLRFNIGGKIYGKKLIKL
ncbi:MAG: DUF2271 domain-containing protein [Bacteroidales bacterium]|nr:DUF2271 domain-containing protein [Bacteroidales bacterium]